MQVLAPLGWDCEGERNQELQGSSPTVRKGVVVVRDSSPTIREGVVVVTKKWPYE
jgi:hypothetical protein